MEMQWNKCASNWKYLSVGWWVTGKLTPPTIFSSSSSLSQLWSRLVNLGVSPRSLNLAHSVREREKGWGKTEQALQSESNGRGKRYTICKAGLHSSIQSGAEIFALFRNKNVGRRSPFCPTLYTEYKVDSSQYVFCGWSPPFSLSFFFLGQTPFSSRLPWLLALPFCIHKSRRYMAWLGGWKFPLANLRLDKIKNFFVLFLSLLGPLKSRRK